MMNKLTKRIISGLLIVTLGLLFIVPISTFAEDKIKDSGKSECENESIDKKYSFTARILSDSEGNVTGFEIEAYKNNDVKNSDLKFKLTKIGDTELNPNDYIEFTPGTKSKPYVLKKENYPNMSSYFKQYSGNLHDIPDDGNRYYTYFHLVSIPGPNASASQCNVGDYVDVKASVGELGPVLKAVTYARETSIGEEVRKGHEISKNSVPNNAFDKLIYDAYHNSIKSQKFTEGTTYYTKNTSTSIWHIPNNATVSLQCDATHRYKSDKLLYSNYYKNVKWMYATTSYKVQGGDYVYHPIDKNSPVKIPGGSCEVTCEEGVKVEYGPPVASKAGLCFQYKVRVTSHVNCYATTSPPEYTYQAYSVCTPTPRCDHPAGYELTRAGPNEEFAACVNECDGGKYSIKCSKKCYKKVYGTSNNNISNQFYNDYVDSIAVTEVDRSKNQSCDDEFGCYYFDGDKIKWAGKETKGNSKLSSMFPNDSSFGKYYFGRYYVEQRGKDKGGTGELRTWVFDRPLGDDRTIYVDGKMIPIYKDFGDGFARMLFGTSAGNYCTTSCEWKGCKNPVKKDNDGNVIGINYYLNGGSSDKTIMQQDDEYNVSVYNELVAKCNAAAKCSTQHAEFYMSVDYKTGDTTKTISFPYDENKPDLTKPNKPDKLCSNNGQETNGCSSTHKNGNSTIIYDANAVEASNDTPTSSKEMHYYENPFGCYDSANKTSSSDDDIDDPNNRRYRATITFPGTWINYKTGEITFKPMTDSNKWEEVEEKFCIPRSAKDVNTKYWIYYQNEMVCKKKVSSINQKDVEAWNIRAYIKDFGLYNWNINVSCFYALDEEDNKCTEPTDVQYRIRSVDLNDLFPDTDGSSRNATSDTGRDPGFNWSDSAAISNSKNAYYNSNPSTLINTIQGVNYGVYSKKYLDYEFNLDTATLNKMRKEINDKNYTDFDEDGFKKSEKAGIGYYYSKKIRNLGKNNKTPSRDIVDLVCNNLQLDESGNYLKKCEVTNGESE